MNGKKPYPHYSSNNPLLVHLDNPFLDKPFYCNDTTFIGIRDCCLNHMVGMPKKNDRVHPFYDYEFEFKQVIEDNQHIWCKKARGIGATTFLTRYLLWQAVSTNRLKGKAIFIIAGTRLEFANVIKKKIEQLLDIKYKHLIRNSKYTECYINDVWIKVFPTKNLDDVRGYTDVAYLFVDEGDSFKPLEREQLMYVIKAYEEKSSGKIILIGTAGPSGGLFETIENDPNSVFYKHYMLVNKGRDKIFNDKFLDEQKKKDPAFYSREYEGRYGYGLGNVFLHDEIENCCALFDNPKINNNCSISLGCDPGFGSSKFGITILQLEDNKIKVLYAKEWERPSYESMINEVAKLRYQYRPNKIYVDGAKPDFIKSLKVQFGETKDYESIIEQAKKEKVDPEYRMYVIPINFNEIGKELLGRFQHVVSKNWFSVSNIEHKQLVTQMRMAKFQDNGNLDKSESNDNTFDVFDSTRLALRMYEMKEKRNGII